VSLKLGRSTTKEERERERERVALTQTAFADKLSIGGAFSDF